MNQNNRVLGRQGARELTPEEMDHIRGAFGTLTVCTFYHHKLDGDAGEC